jgi:hypothetical protein
MKVPYKYYTEFPRETTWFTARAELLVIVALLAGLVLGCTEAVETTEPERTEEEKLLMDMPDNVYFIPHEEAEEFNRALMDFHSKVYIKDGRLEVDYQIGRDPAIPSRWLSQFYEALHSVNYMVETGEITLEDLERKETITIEDFLQPPDKSGGNRLPDGIRVFHHGGSRYSIHFSHEAATWLFVSGGITGLIIGNLGSPLGSGLYYVASSVFAAQYHLYGQGGGFILNSWGFLKWVEYPPPIETDEEMEF